jgi:hypothetical protein
VNYFKLILPALFVACGPPEAPETLDDLSSFLFEHIWDADEDYLTVGIENLDTWLDSHFEATQDGYSVTNLSQEAVASLEGDGRLVEGLMGAAVGYDVAYPSEQIVLAMAFEDPMLLYPGDYEVYTRDYQTDTECFKTRDCMTLEFYQHVQAFYPLGIEIEADSRTQYHWVETQHGWSGVYRNWSRSPPIINKSWLTVDQQYYVAVSIPKADGTTRRVEAMWVIAEIGNASVPEGMALNMTIDTMKTTGPKLTAFFESQEE